MVDYKKTQNEEPKLATIHDDEENTVQHVEDDKKYKKNLNISNNIKNIWMDVNFKNNFF